MKKTIVVFIIFLFLVSSLTPMAIGFNSKVSEDDDLEHLFENLRFICTDARGLDETRYEHYKEMLVKQYSDKDLNDFQLVEEIEPTVHEEQQATSTMSSGPMDSPWPMQSHDTHHTGRSPYSTPYNLGVEKWRFKCSYVEDTPVIDNDGAIYFGDCGGMGGYLYALNLNGTFKWKYKAGGVIWGSSPAIAEDGTIYVGSWDDYLHAVNQDGTMKWMFLSGADISSSPAIADDGTIYFGNMLPGNRIYAVNPNGTEKWRYQTGDVITSDPAIGDDGTVYIGSCDGYLYAMNPNGTLKWRFHTNDEIHGHPAIGDDGTIYIGSWDDQLYALYPNGTMKWKISTQWGTSNCASIDKNGTIYVGTDRLYAIYPNGTRKWNFNLGADRWVGKSSPAISADGTIYIGVEIGNMAGGEIIAVNSDGTEKWRRRIANDWTDSSPSIGEDGTLYIGSTYDTGAGYLHAFGPAELTADANGPYHGLTNQPVQFTGSATGGHIPYDWHWDFGDTYTSEEQNPTHTYTSPGNYTVILTVTDNKSYTENDTTYAWIQTSNTPPDKPIIDGPKNGAAGTTYDYKFTAADPDNSIIYLYVDWGDVTNTGWVGPYNSGQQVILSHSWSKQDTYTIKARAKDPYDAEGPWETLVVTMPKNKMLYNPLLLRLLERFPLLKLLFSNLLNRF